MIRKLFGNQSSSSAPTAPAQVAADERIYAVGDVHGRHDLLEAIMVKIADDIPRFSDGRTPRIIFLGDYVDRGDHARDVLETLSGLAVAKDRIFKELGIRLDFLAGNHEIALLEFLADPVKGRAWLEWGGRQTLASFGTKPASRHLSDTDLVDLRDTFAPQIAPYLEFLEGLSRLIISGDVVFVHAGLDPEAPLDAQPDEATLWGRAPSDRKLGMEGYRMVHGHFANFEPVSRPHRVCVDTGAYYSGRLTAVRLDDEETFLHVDTADLPLPSGSSQTREQ